MSNNNNIKIIHQFLLHHHFEGTAETLIQEASNMGFQNLEGKLGTITDHYAWLITCFDTGDYLTFFQLWSDLFSDNIKECNEYKKLTFYLHVHFAILPKHRLYIYQNKDHKAIISGINTSTLPSTSRDSSLERNEMNNATEIEKTMNDSMEQLQDYLNGDGKELEHDTELQPFYTLPFTKNPYTDSFFSTIFKQDWLDDLSRKLDLFIINHRQDLVDLNNINHNKTHSPKQLQVHTIVPKTKITESKNNTSHKLITNNAPIVPNDRDIPTFVEDNDHEEQYRQFHKTNHNLKSSFTQTYITGDQITINYNSRETKLNQEENIGDLLKIHEQDQRLIHCNQELTLTKTHLYCTRISYEKLKCRFHKLHGDYHKLIDVAGELIVALENSVKGQSVDLQRTLEICMKIFPDVFNQNIRETSYPSLLQLSHTDVKTTALPMLDIGATPVLPKLLDFKKIKLHLLNGDVKTKLLLLQALRWKITLAQSMEQDEILHEYINSDLLGLHGQIATDSGKPVLPYLLTAGEAYERHLLQQFTARLLNTLASFRCGRDYLSVGSTIVNITIACLNNNYIDGVDSFACDMLLAMLQKLSLRRQQRIYMIESGLLEWLINHLHDNSHFMSSYRLEYATALLMNMSLHRLAQAKASKISSLLISTLLILLSIDHASSLPYINGALHNFLRNPVINEEAREMKRSDVSDYFVHNKKYVDVRKHLDYILKIQRHESNNTPWNEETTDEDNEDIDILENELDENDPLKNNIGELNGETLLAMCYSVSSKIPQEAITTDTALQKISALNPVDFYNNRHNHLCNRPLRSTLRCNIKKKRKISSKENYTKQITLRSPNPFSRVAALSNTSIKEQKIILDITNKKLSSVNKVQNIAKNLSRIESSLTMKYNNAVYERKNPPIEIDNIQTAELKLHRSVDWIGIEKLLDEKLRPELEQLSSNGVKVFKQKNTTEKFSPDNTIYLFENQASTSSSEMVVTSSMTLASTSANDQKETEKLSSIASLIINNYDNNIISKSSWKNDPEIVKEEEAFLAKPKISRTPP